MVGSAYGETQVRQVEKIEDTAYNDLLTASDAAHRVSYRMNNGGIDVLETGEGRDSRPNRATRRRPRGPPGSHPPGEHGTVAVRTPSLSDDPDYSLTDGDGNVYTTEDLLSVTYAHDFDASAGDRTVAVVYEGVRTYLGGHGVVLQLYDLEGNKTGPEVLVGKAHHRR